MNKQAVCGDAARHEVMIQMTDDVQLLCSNLFTNKTSFSDQWNTNQVQRATVLKEENHLKHKICLLYFIQFKFKLPLNASLTHLLFSSHLCILSKEPVLVTTLHSQQSILMLLFQLDHLLLKGGENALWTPGGGATVQWRTQLCTLSSSCLGKLREVNSLQK